MISSLRRSSTTCRSWRRSRRPPSIGDCASVWSSLAVCCCTDRDRAAERHLEPARDRQAGAPAADTRPGSATGDSRLPARQARCDQLLGELVCPLPEGGPRPGASGRLAARAGPPGRDRLVGRDGAARSYVDQYHLTYPNLIDPDGVDRRTSIGLNGLPTTFILDSQGKITAVLRGPQSTDSLLRALHVTSQAEFLGNCHRAFRPLPASAGKVSGPRHRAKDVRSQTRPRHRKEAEESDDGNSLDSQRCGGRRPARALGGDHAASVSPADFPSDPAPSDGTRTPVGGRRRRARAHAAERGAPEPAYSE